MPFLFLECFYNIASFVTWFFLFKNFPTFFYWLNFCMLVLFKKQESYFQFFILLNHLDFLNHAPQTIISDFSICTCPRQHSFGVKEIRIFFFFFFDWWIRKHNRWRTFSWIFLCHRLIIVPGWKCINFFPIDVVFVIQQCYPNTVRKQLG